MPAAPRTTLTEIVTAGRRLVEEGGVNALTMQAVAEQVGVRPPSLYKRVRDRDQLLALVVTATVEELGDRQAEVAVRGSDPRQRLRRLARDLRAFAHEHRQCYALAFGPLPETARPPRESLERSVAPVLSACADIVGEAEALDAARTLTSWATGFLSLELMGGFQLGAEVDRAFDYGLDLLVRAL